jgi:hypothetical protein
MAKKLILVAALLGRNSEAGQQEGEGVLNGSHYWF